MSLIRKKRFILNGLLFLLAAMYPSNSCMASGCCARNVAAPTLILGENRYQLNLAGQLSDSVGTTDSAGNAYFHSKALSETTHTLRLEAAFLVSDRFQLGASLPWVRRAVHQKRKNRPPLDQSYSGLGDLRLSGGYEFLPLWHYSAWQPQGFLFGVLTFPTSRSIYDAQAPAGIDALGNGFFSTSLGAFFLKQGSVGDWYVSPEIHYSFPRTFYLQNHAFEVRPGWGSSILIGGGISLKSIPFRIGLRVQPRIDQSRRIPFLKSATPLGTRSTQKATAATSCDVGVDLSYRIHSQITLMVAYTDQTLLGPAVNSNLNRTFSMNLMAYWER